MPCFVNYQYRSIGNRRNKALHWIVIYPVDGVIHLSNNPGLVFNVSHATLAFLAAPYNLAIAHTER